MTDAPKHPAGKSANPSVANRAIREMGSATLDGLRKGRNFVEDVGGMTGLLFDTVTWTLRSLFMPKVRFRLATLVTQMVRVGVNSIGIIVLVQAFIGCILSLQLAPTLERYGQLERIADVIAIGVIRELGPMITAIVLSGFAGASIAAELGAMVESEEIKALRAHALDPIQFLVVPRFLATVLMIVGLTVIANVVGIAGGYFTSWLVLNVDPEVYIESTKAALVLSDLTTGLVKAGIFGMLISMIACYEGLTVSGGAVGVGNATTSTVVKSIVAIIGTDAIITAIFFAFGL